jgi:ribonucleoside-diphosphate reductase alpha chain
MTDPIKNYSPQQAILNIALYKERLKSEAQLKDNDLNQEGVNFFHGPQPSLGLDILKKKYCYEEAQETTVEDCFARTALAFSEDYESAKAIYKDMITLNFIPATPILANGGLLKRGMPISCFLNESGSTLEEKITNLGENARISQNWGGIGTLIDGLASKDLMVYCKLLESANWAFYNDDRKSSVAVYLSISHAGVEDFIELRRPVGGDHRLKSLHLHHGLLIPDEFFYFMQENKPWPLYENDGTFVKEVDAFELWKRIIKIRMETGEPYIVYGDRLKESAPLFHKQQGIFPKTSNLCTEITLPTGGDRTAVCCLGSLNLDRYDTWREDDALIKRAVTFLDNVLSYFKYFFKDTMPRAVFSVEQENSIGLGAMGFHSLLQRRNIPMESTEAEELNKEIFQGIQLKVKAASKELALARGACKDAQRVGVNDVRFSYDIAIAPNATISHVGGCSPGIEPYISNTMLIKNGMGTYTSFNPHLLNLLKNNQEFNTNDIFREKTMKEIMKNHGSVKTLDFLDNRTKDTYKTAYEINQLQLIKMAGERQKYISQAQSLNFFFMPQTPLSQIMKIHTKAYTEKVKTIYYSRTIAFFRADATLNNIDLSKKVHDPSINYSQSNFEIACEGCI